MKGFISIAVFFIMFFSAFTSSSFDGDLTDGIFEGEYSFVKVQVEVRDGEVDRINMVSHGGGGEVYAGMVEPMVEEIFAAGTTDVDIVTGATVSSENLKRAVENALEKSRK